MNFISRDLKDLSKFHVWIFRLYILSLFSDLSVVAMELFKGATLPSVEAMVLRHNLSQFADAHILSITDTLYLIFN